MNEIYSNNGNEIYSNNGNGLVMNEKIIYKWNKILTKAMKILFKQK